MNIVKYSYNRILWNFLYSSENESMMRCIGMNKYQLCNWKKGVAEKYTQYDPISVDVKNVTHDT